MLETLYFLLIKDKRLPFDNLSINFLRIIYTIILWNIIWVIAHIFRFFISCVTELDFQENKNICRNFGNNWYINTRMIIVSFYYIFYGRTFLKKLMAQKLNVYSFLK